MSRKMPDKKSLAVGKLERSLHLLELLLSPYYEPQGTYWLEYIIEKWN